MFSKFMNHGAMSAFRYRNYRLWFIGQLISLFGTWMQTTAQGFLIYELTHSPAYLGLVGFFAGVPAWLFALYGGVVADRIHRRTLLIITQVTMMILAFILAALVLTHMIQPWHILVLSFFLGIATAFDSPARMAFVLDIVNKEHLTNAISMNSIMYNLSMITGPAIAGITYAVFGPGWCFLINGISFFAIIIGLFLMRFDNKVIIKKAGSSLKDFKEGFSYVMSHKSIRSLFMLIAAMTLFGFAFITLIPAWSVVVLHGGATTNGIMQSMRGLGALLMAVFLAIRMKNTKKGKRLVAISFILPLIIIAFAFANIQIVSFIIIAAFGAAWLYSNNMISFTLQTSIKEELRGRVLSFWTFIFFGFIPLGSLWIGFVAGRIGEVYSVLIAGFLTLLCSILLWKFAPQLREID